MSIFMVFKLMVGLTFFLFGMRVMSESLEKMAGSKLEMMIKRMTENPVVSLVLGAAITIAMQSSSATTVMLVGLVNSGIMKFSQTINVIFGANVGTTLTSWIFSLSGIQSDNIWIRMMKPENFCPIIAIIGTAMLMVSKKDRNKSIGTVFVGFTILIYGMEFMSDSVSPLAELPEFGNVLMKFNNPFFAVIVATAFTAIIQSSAASIGILQALSLTGDITYGMAIPIVVGQNIGTAATAIISCIGTNTNAKRVAAVNLIIKVISTVICLPLFYMFNFIFEWNFLGNTVNPVTIAIVHTLFNIIATVLLMPFSKWIAIITKKFVKNTSAVSDEENDIYIDERLLRSPSIAIAECINHTNDMACIAKKNMNLALSLIDNYDAKTAEIINHSEQRLDMYEDKLGAYLAKLSMQSLSDSDSKTVLKIIHVVGNYERIGDHALNITDIAKENNLKNAVFSEDAKLEITNIKNAIEHIVSITTDAFTLNDIKKAEMVEPLEQVIDELTEKAKKRHIERVQNGSCIINFCFSFLDYIANFERISDHCSNIAASVMEAKYKDFSAHKYLNEVKHGDNNFYNYYRDYKKQYEIKGE